MGLHTLIRLKINDKKKKSKPAFPSAEFDVSSVVVLADKQSKTPKYYIYNDAKPRNEVNFVCVKLESEKKCMSCCYVLLLRE